MRYTPNTPEGTRDRLFAECRERRGVQDALTGLFARRGYDEIITPEVEYYDLFAMAGNAMPQERMMKIIDRSGKIMVLRPDCTTPIARVAATKLKDMVLPQRLYYNQTVFRSGESHVGGSSEIAQCGVELIGASGEKADLEIIVMAVDALRACGLENFHIEIGHAGYFRSVAQKLDMDAEQLETLRGLIEGKEFAALAEFLAPYDGQPAAKALLRLSRLFGTGEVLDEAEALSGADGSIAYLREVYTQLNRAGYGQYIRFDLGLLHQMDYYTGMVFRGYVAGAGTAVLSGGRYDSLAGFFGRPAEATGFAVDVDAVTRCLPDAVLPQLEVVVHYDLDQLAAALAVVDGLPGGTCALSPCRTLESTLNLAREKGAQRVLVLENGTKREVVL
jgi:ATP phosphoribosyltransferase regulatory subunit